MPTKAFSQFVVQQSVLIIFIQDKLNEFCIDILSLKEHNFSVASKDSACQLFSKILPVLHENNKFGVFNRTTHFHWIASHKGLCTTYDYRKRFIFWRMGMNGTDHNSILLYLLGWHSIYYVHWISFSCKIRIIK